uniref:Beta-defensin n=3 Tax=Canis lupus TaxID=9612 RepID=A0A8C0TBZ8_CANLF
MKSLLFTLSSFMLLTQLVSGNWYVRKCANKTGNCRSVCRPGEMATVPPTGMCPKEKMCCILSACGETTKTTNSAQASESSTTTPGPRTSPRVSPELRSLLHKAKGFTLVSLFLLHPLALPLHATMSGRASHLFSTSRARGGMQIR